MKKEKITINTYSYNDYLIDIVINQSCYEGWIYTDNAGLKMLIFGCPKTQQTLEDFITLIEDNIADYIPLFEELMLEGE